MDCMRDGFEPGKLLGNRFVTTSPLNHGSFGLVFAARDTLTGQDVAIKCITKSGAAEKSPCPAAIAIDERSEELAIHSHLSTHPNIVNLVHDFDTDNHQYMVLELCSNGDLYEAIRVGRGPLETGHVRDFMLELVSAIDHLHTNGVYHRDIKPENIFLTANGTMKLGDFGLATTDTWSTEFAVGSDRYMAPEQFDASVYGYGYSPASADVWAIGIVLLNVLFQRNPFATPTPKDPLFADFARDRQSLFDVFPNMSQDTYNVLVHSMALDPANRSLAGVREALNNAVSFTTDDESLDDFCSAEPPPLAPVATAAREPLRTPSISSPNNGDEYPWTSTLLKTPQRTSRQLSTIRDEESEMFPASVKSSEWQYVDTDEASLSSNLDSGLGMSYKSAKSIKSVASRPLANFVGSLPISFSRPSNKTSSPYGATGNGFSKSWSDLWDEDEEMEQQERVSFDGMDIERMDTAKPSTPRLNSIREEDRGSVTPRPGLIEVDANLRTATASPLRQLVEADKKSDQSQSPKQRSASIMDKWAVLGNFRRARAEQVVPVAAAPVVSAPVVTPAAPTPIRSKYTDKFAGLTSFSSGWKQKTPSRERATTGTWRQTSPQRLRSTSVNNSRLWERKDPSPTNDAWARADNWREHMGSPEARRTGPPSPPAPPAQAPLNSAMQHSRNSHKTDKNFLDIELDHDDGDDMEWVGGWRDFHV
ncbi:cAMP-dependent protein kinase catalytic subunit [Recurvomyces mirabilis]|nr:cAMP-dependent protein kinase catalytic subunit [Recurvomyces mirabilis]